MVLISYFVADKHRCATPSRSLDDDCSAGHLYRCNWRASSRRPHTRATCERRTDAKAFSDDAVVDVEVDRCIIPSYLRNIYSDDILTDYFWMDTG